MGRSLKIMLPDLFNFNHLTIGAVRQIMKQYSKVEAIHAILAMRGLNYGNASLPFKILNKENQENLSKELTEMNLLERKNEE
ncbi:MAG: hypothetical protein ACYC59_05530 [Anaerolineaceae bacterium]